MPTDDRDLFRKINESDVKSFEILFHRYYGYLCLYASKIVKSDSAAEEIVQDFFVKLWEKRDQLIIESSVKSYFFSAIRNHCLNYIQHSKIVLKHEQKMLSEQEQKTSFDQSFVEIGLAEKIEESIRSLPEKRQEIFRLSREEGLKYREIAEKLNLSIKTVETHMSLAIKSLRESLKNYNSFFNFFLLFSEKRSG